MRARVQGAGQGGPGAGWPPTLVYLGALAAVATGYLAIFASTREVGPGRLMVLTARNTISLVLVAGLARAALLRFVEPLSPPWRVLPHAVGAGCFTALWYWSLMVLGGLFDGASATSFSVKPFLWGQAAEWQLFQGLFAYAVVAMLAHGEARAAATPNGPEPDASAAPSPEPRGAARMLVRMGDEIVAIEPGEIVSITGADDYAELTVTTARHLVRTTLAEFEEALPPERFLRVHRSAIVNLDRVVRAEPAGGGRMLLHMETGPVVQASRVGARALRERLV
jgi:hypothetical protein